MTNLSEMAVLARASAARTAWRQARSREWLESTYARHLYGGWEREDGRWIDEPHLLGMRFHEACKSLWCPVCLLCNKGTRDCRCRPPQACWAYLGQIGKDWTDTFRCPTHPEHGDVPARHALYKSVFALAGNRPVRQNDSDALGSLRLVHGTEAMGRHADRVPGSEPAVADRLHIPLQERHHGHLPGDRDPHRAHDRQAANQRRGCRLRVQA